MGSKGGGGGKGSPTAVDVPGVLAVENQPSGVSGVSPFDLNMLKQSMGLNEGAIANRYAQLGLSGPGGTPSTMQQQDTAQQNLITGANLGQIQTQNLNDPAAPGSPANIGQIIAAIVQNASAANQSQTLSQLASNSGFDVTGLGTGNDPLGGASNAGLSGLNTDLTGQGSGDTANAGNTGTSGGLGSLGSNTFGVG
jgi:hypothetical protein